MVFHTFEFLLLIGYQEGRGIIASLVARADNVGLGEAPLAVGLPANRNIIRWVPSAISYFSHSFLTSPQTNKQNRVCSWAGWVCCITSLQEHLFIISSDFADEMSQLPPVAWVFILPVASRLGDREASFSHSTPARFSEPSSHNGLQLVLPLRSPLPVLGPFWNREPGSSLRVRLR